MDNRTLPAVLDNQGYRGQTSDATEVCSENPVFRKAEETQEDDGQDKYSRDTHVELGLKRLQAHTCIAGVAHIALPDVRAHLGPNLRQTKIIAHGQN
jgi:hypothetical protein